MNFLQMTLQIVATCCVCNLCKIVPMKFRSNSLGMIRSCQIQGNLPYKLSELIKNAVTKQHKKKNLMTHASTYLKIEKLIEKYPPRVSTTSMLNFLSR